MRILVVEDDRDLSRQLSAALTEANYAVDVAYDGEEGHYLGEGEPYDAIVLDLGLPAMDGVTVFHAGTALADGKVTASGGRVLGVTATAPTIAGAQTRAYAAVDAIDWLQGFCRRDIGWRALGG